MWYNGNESNASELYHLYVLVLQIIGERSIFYYNPSDGDCNWIWFQQHNFTSQPQWVWHIQEPFLNMKEQHNSQLFVMACLSQERYVTELTSLTESLKRLKNVQVLIELASAKKSRKEVSMALNILMYLRNRNMLNVALYFQNGTQPLTLYSFKVFPQFALMQQRITDLGFTGRPGVLYPNQLKNLKGYQLQALHDWSEPSTIMYRDASGKTHVTGFMWNFISTFADYLGARIIPMHPPWPPGRLLSEAHMLEFTRNGSVDFGLITLSVKHLFRRYQQYSYPISFSSWCIMMPLERPIRRSAMLGQILEAKALVFFLTVFICSFLCRGLGFNRLPLWIRNCWRCLRLTPTFLALFLLSICLAQLYRLMVCHPQRMRIDNFDALLESDLHIFGLQAEFDRLHDDFRARYAGAFRLTGNLSEFFRMRNSLNTSWAYSITATKWSIYQEQQRHFARPLFRYSDLCLIGYIPETIVLAEDSIYRDTINLYTMRVQQSGLLLHWIQHSLYDMVKARKMQFKDYSTPLPVGPLRLKDFKLAYRLYGVGLLLALLVFGVEVLRFYVNVCLNHL